MLERKDVFRDGELAWAERFEFLKSRGYLLRPRYSPGWQPTWEEDDVFQENADYHPPHHPHVLDAVRESDRRTVTLKYASKDTPEIEIGQYLMSSDDIKNDPQNHCIPLLDVLRDDSDPEHVILVFPLLRPLHEPPPVSVRECVDFVQQTLEGLVFLHKHKIAHR
ncbi:hypothetical protein FRB99_008868 [Tulasnella sp. 403]|nr:hypothetical protein FRB99_008868 [Tulasnella sp. 403]